MTSVYDPQAFAKWLTDAFASSHYKSWQAVADRISSSRSTLSRYAGAKPQFMTGKPSRPDPDFVIKLARLFERNVDEALMIAGHAPLSGDSEAGLFSGLRKLSPEKQKLAQRQIRAIIESLSDDDEPDTDYIDE